MSGKKSFGQLQEPEEQVGLLRIQLTAHSSRSQDDCQGQEAAYTVADCYVVLNESGGTDFLLALSIETASNRARKRQQKAVTPSAICRHSLPQPWRWEHMEMM